MSKIMKSLSVITLISTFKKRRFIMTIKSWKDNGNELKLYLPKEFNFEENLNYLSRNS